MNKRKLENHCDEDLNVSNSAKKAKKVPKIFDGIYYELIDWDGKSTNIQAKCIDCKGVIKGAITSTGNFYKHYRVSHQDEFKFMKEHCETKLESNNAVSKKNQSTMLPFVNMLDHDKVIVLVSIEVHWQFVFFSM